MIYQTICLVLNYDHTKLYETVMEIKHHNVAPSSSANVRYINFHDTVQASSKE